MDLRETITFVEAKEKYMNYMSDYKNNSKWTLVIYSNLLDEFHAFLKYHKNTFEVKIKEIDIDDIHAYIQHKKTSISLRTKRRISQNTLYLHSAAIRGFFKYMNAIDASSLYFTKIEYVPTEPPMVHHLTDEEFNALVNAPDYEPRTLIRYRNKAIMYLGYYCWLRAHEILSVRFSDIPRDWWSIFIRWKRKAIRQVRIKKEIADIIYSYKEKKKEILGEFWGSASDTICTTFSNNSKKDKPLNVSAITWLFQKYRKKLGINMKTTSHCLRRKFWTDLYKKGTPLEVIQKLMGHKNIMTTLRYTKIPDEILMENCLKLQ